MMVRTGLVAVTLMLSACGTEGSQAPTAANNTATQPSPAAVSLTRLDCGSIEVKDFSASFSDQQIYPHGPKRLTDSCYLIRHGDQQMLWDTGLPEELKSKPEDANGMVASLPLTLTEQLAKLGIKPADIDVVGISHMHFDHVGQAKLFPQARLIVGKADFEQSAAKDDPFMAWRGNGKPVSAATGNTDVFGDGTVVALALPGHTPSHQALLVRLASGPVLLSGDLYHATQAREQRGVPPFNTDRAQTLASMDKFEALAKQLGAKVVIQHEPADVAKLPAFPQAAK